MAKANGYAASGSVDEGSGDGDGSMHAKYTRTTELRRVEDNDIYKLSSFLNINDSWRKLMARIPKGLDAKASSAPGALNYDFVVRNSGLKYTAQHISQIDDYAKAEPHKSISQIMIDEWKTSGQQNERPTVGVLLQLLVQADLFSAANFVAQDFLNEPKPERPADGPAAHLSLDLSEDMDIDHDGAAVAGTIGMNLDYDKRMVASSKNVPHPSQNGENGGLPPVAPPRASRLSRMSRTTASNALPLTSSIDSITPSAANVPNLSILNASSPENLQDRPEQSREQELQDSYNIPVLSILHADSAAGEAELARASSKLSAGRTERNGETTPNVPQITLLFNSSGTTSGMISTTTTAVTATTQTTSYHNLPEISALNLNSAIQHNGADNAADNSSNSSISNDEDDDDDEEDADVSLPNLSNSEQQNSNNDSSLTTVTGTSGENSFELTHDSSSTSNDDYTNNIPNLSELQH
ncbi:protein Tube [Scaptodrosophila lebanonensis]|uniref:Protein Tube n=1 Tax=Drosophila lebanonensis TaxID=7225 RepID=A0A6J2T8H3_DROLE|nr:protein Tube [Scaptodrosophila lebanonensis]